MSSGEGPGKLHFSQDYELLVPKTGPAFLIPCGEWDYLKEQLNRISTQSWVFQSIGFLMLGAALSTFITILIGTFKVESKEIVIAWAVVVVTLLCGLVFVIFAWMERGLKTIVAGDIVKQMELIEKR